MEDVWCKDRRCSIIFIDLQYIDFPSFTGHSTHVNPSFSGEQLPSGSLFLQKNSAGSYPLGRPEGRAFHHWSYPHDAVSVAPVMMEKKWLDDRGNPTPIETSDWRYQKARKKSRCLHGRSSLSRGGLFKWWPSLKSTTMGISTHQTRDLVDNAWGILLDHQTPGKRTKHHENPRVSR